MGSWGRPCNVRGGPPVSNRMVVCQGSWLRTSGDPCEHKQGLHAGIGPGASCPWSQCARWGICIWWSCFGQNGIERTPQDPEAFLQFLQFQLGHTSRWLSVDFPMASRTRIFGDLVLDLTWPLCLVPVEFCWRASLGYLPSEVGLDRSGYLIYVSFIQGSLDLRCNDQAWQLSGLVCVFLPSVVHMGHRITPHKPRERVHCPNLGSLGRGEMDLGLTWACVGTP